MKKIYDRSSVPSWWYMFKFELAGWLGRIFYCRKPPVKSRLLHLGCGNVYFDDFVNADYYYLRWLPFRQMRNKCDWLLDFRRKFNCPDNYWEGVFTEHTLEHLHYSDCLKCFKELHRTMKPGAWMRICVPGLEETLALPLNNVTLAELVYHLTQNYGHASVWNADLMFEVLRDAGFTVMHKSSYLSGADKRLLRDSQARSAGSLHSSLYIEVQK